MPRARWTRRDSGWLALLFAGFCCIFSSRAEAANLTFIAGNTNGMTNSEVVVPVRVREFINVSSFQFSLHWNTNVGTYIGVESFGLPGLSATESFGTPFTSTGTLTVAWFEPQGGAQTLVDDSVLFGLRLRLVGPPTASGVVAIDGSPTAIDAGNEQLEHLPVTVTSGVLSVDHTLLYLCPNNKTEECGTVWNFNPPVVSDSCSASTNGVVITVLSSLTNTPGTCGFTTTRTWEILDQCSNRATCSQTVTVVDTTPPVVACVNDKTVEFGSPWSFDAPIASDTCTPASNLITRIVSTVTDTNSACGSAFIATQVREILDACSNRVTCTQVVTVRDTTAPMITCAPAKTVSCLGPWVFDIPTAIDEASGTVITPVALGTITNGSCGNDFTATRTWRATDACGNSSTCIQIVFGRAIVDVSGTVFLPTNYPAVISDKRVAGTVVIGPSNAVTAADGTYHSVFNATNNVVIIPQASGGNPADGINVLDIFAVRSHILSVAPLANPYSLLGGDVDGSSTVNTLDLSYMRRVLLGSLSQFPLGLWRFIPANHSFANPLSPWNPPTNRTYANVVADMSGQDFVVVKLGDVNASWASTGGAGFTGGPGKSLSIDDGESSGISPSPSPILFEIGTTNTLPGNDVIVPIRVTGFSNVVGFQFSVHWNPAVAALVGLEQFGVPFNPSMYNMAMSNSGTLTVAWNDETGGMTTIADDTSVFSVRFKCIGSASTTTSVYIDGSPTAFEAAADNQIVPSSTTPGSIILNQSNRPPVLAAISNKTVDEETLLSFTASAADPDGGQTHTFSFDAGAPAGATIHPTTGAFNWTPTEAQGPGVYSVTIRVTDDGTPAPLSDAKTFTIEVYELNTPPTAFSEAYATGEDTPLTVSAPGVLANDTDLDGHALTAVLVNPPIRGTLTLNPNGSFIYTPTANVFGTDSFTYRANDGVANSPVVTVSLTISSLNDTPMAVNDGPYLVQEDSSLIVPATAGILSNDSDGDGDLFFVILVSATTNGSLTVQGNGSFGYTPNSNFSGQDYFTYRITDGAATSSVAVVTLNVNPVNDTPVANNDNYATDEDVTLSRTTPGVLANDSDLDGNVLTAVLVNTTTNGVLVLNANGSFNYTPAAGFFGTDSFTYRAHDGVTNSSLATVSISVA
ncbi:MAG TPA: tandem-95 repeat protein, partial [Candidatus Acidoferrum sp.]|nr:tandem-95 repeat protein [Candidatus Acidoferrum sp.]